MKNVYSKASELPPTLTNSSLVSMPYPRKVLMCPPDYFQVVDVKNSFMAGQEGKVNSALAVRQWEALVQAFQELGITVETIPAEPGLEDMVFCANQTFVGLANERRVCVPSHMRFPSRRREVPAFMRWFTEKGYEVRAMGTAESVFEGGGDILWHPGKRLLWGGVGPRTDGSVYPELAAFFGSPILKLNLVSESFYHLDTCFTGINETTALICPEAFDSDGLALIRFFFPDVIEVPRVEATTTMACNATAVLGKSIVIQKGASHTVSELRKRKFNVVEVETDEFMKSGGSVFCMKLALF